MDTKSINIEGLEHYRINTAGEVFGPRGKKTALFCMPYPFYKLTNKKGEHKNYTVHRLLGLTFIPNPDDKPEINHIDHDKTNYRLENLEWVTHQENIEKARAADRWAGKQLGTKPGTKFSYETKSKMSEKKKKKVMLISKDGQVIELPSLNDTADFFGITRVMLFYIRKDGRERNGYKIQLA